MAHPSCPALRFRVCSHLARSCSKGNLWVPPPIIVVTGYKVSWSPFNSLVFGPSSSSWRDESRRVNHSAQKVRPKWPKQRELIKFEIRPTQFEVLFWLTCPGDQVMPYKSQPFTLEQEAEKKPDSSLTWYPKLIVKRCFNSYGTVLKGERLGVISGCCLICTTGVTYQTYMWWYLGAGLLFTAAWKDVIQLHFTHLTKSVPSRPMFQLGLRDLSQAQERDNPDWTNPEQPWHLIPPLHMVHNGCVFSEHQTIIHKLHCSSLLVILGLMWIHKGLVVSSAPYPCHHVPQHPGRLMRGCPISDQCDRRQALKHWLVGSGAMKTLVSIQGRQFATLASSLTSKPFLLLELQAAHTPTTWLFLYQLYSRW